MSPSGDAGSPASRWAVAGSFLLLFLLHAWLLVSSLKRDARPPSARAAAHLRAAWKYKNDLSAGSFSGLWRSSPRSGPILHPPLARLAMAAGFRSAPSLGLEPEDGAALPNLLFLMILAGAVYMLASDWWDPAAGVAAAWLASLSPPFVDLARQLQADVALSAWVAAAYAFWNASRGFSLWGWTLALGAACAAGGWTEPSFPTYVLPIAFSIGWTLLKSRERGDRGRALVALAMAFAPAAWYVANLAASLLSAPSAAQGGLSVQGWDAWFYFLGVFKNQLGWTGLAAAMAGFVWLALWRPKNGWVLISWVVSSYAWWTVFPEKDPRRLLPALAALPLLASSLPFRIPLLLAAMLTGSQMWAFHAAASRSFPPWPLGDIVAKAAALRRDPERPAVLTPVAVHDALNEENLRWYVDRGGLDASLVIGSPSSDLGVLSEFVLVKSGDLGPARAAEGVERRRGEALRPDGWFQRQFSIAAEWALPDGSGATLFQRVDAASAPVVQMAAAGVVPRLLGEMEGLEVACGEGPAIEGEKDCDVLASRFRTKGLILRDVSLHLEGLRVTADDEGRPRFLALRRVRVNRFRLTESDAALFLGLRAKSFKKGSVRFLGDNGAEVTARWKGVPIRFRAEVAPTPPDSEGPLSVYFSSVKVLGVPVPVKGRWIFLERGSPPFAVVLPGLRTVPAAAGEEGFAEGKSTGP